MLQLATLRQQAYDRIRLMLVSGQIVPGRQVSETGLAKTLGMSRTPIREAVRQMEIEGLLEYAPHYGAVVRVLEREELEEMYAVREVLEAYAAGEATTRMTPEQLKKVRDLCDKMRSLARQVPKTPAAVLDGENLREFLAADMEFHRLIIQAAGNSFMSKILGNTHLLERIFRSTDWVYERKSLAEANRFHWRLLRSLETHDAESARRWTAEAMRVSKRNALARFASRASFEDHDEEQKRNIAAHFS